MQKLVRFVSSNKVATLNAVGLLLISIGVLLLFQRQHRHDWWSWAMNLPVLDLDVLPDGPAQLLQPLEGGIAITARRLSFHAHQTSAC